MSTAPSAICGLQRIVEVERKFKSLQGKVHALFDALDIDDDIKHGLWPECASTAYFYENRIIITETQQSLLKMMFKTQCKKINKAQNLFRNVCCDNQENHSRKVK